MKTRHHPESGETPRKKLAGLARLGIAHLFTDRDRALAVLVETPNELAFRNALWELALLTLMDVALVGLLLMRRKRSATPIPEQA